jgi:hypothetical protein
VIPVSTLNFCSEESLRVRGLIANCQLPGESNLADIDLMREAKKTIHSEQRGWPTKSEQG